MKTERRHELQTNVLADSLSRWIEAAKPYSRAAVAALVALVAGIFAWSYYTSQARHREADGWSEYYDAFNTRDPREGLSDVVERYPGTNVARWARVVLADIQLDDGTNRLFVDKAAGREELRKTIDAYQAVLLESDEPALGARATFGIARAREALSQDLAKARDEYRSLVKRWPDSPYAAPAKARADDLDRAETKQFYDWFAKYEKPRTMSNQPGTPGARPDFLKDPLDPGGLKMPSILDDASKAGEAPTIPPAAEGAAPAEPSEQKPDDQPSSEPSSEKPAESPAEPAAEPK
jgi:hypothetical protein